MLADQSQAGLHVPISSRSPVVGRDACKHHKAIRRAVQRSLCCLSCVPVVICSRGTRKTEGLSAMSSDKCAAVTLQVCLEVCNTLLPEAAPLAQPLPLPMLCLFVAGWQGVSEWHRQTWRGAGGCCCADSTDAKWEEVKWKGTW